APPEPVRPPPPPEAVKPSPVAPVQPTPAPTRPKPRERVKATPPQAVPTPVAAPPSAPAESASVPVEAASAGPPDRLPDHRADYLRNPKPHYPNFARRMGREGVVVLRVEVNAEGAATAVAIARSSGYPELDEAAREAVERWRFVPAQRGGKAVAETVEVPVRFRLTEGAS
ncbi:MAG: energy transducer TonB, partial [Magnetococcales bacterium]|nr:energy transducer TonB [Magnetococcales bacterium]